MDKKMKAWIVRKNGKFCNTVVFAETRGRAKTRAMRTDACCETDFISIECTRYPIADKMYNGRTVMDWDNPKDRLFLVKECGCHCDYYSNFWDCYRCVAKDYCDKYEDLIECESTE